MKLSKLANAHTALKKLGEFSSEEIPVTFFYGIAKIIKALTPEFDFYSEKLRELIKQYADKDKDGNIFGKDGSFSIPAERAEEFLQKQKELDDIECDLDFKPVTVKSDWRLPISGLELVALEDFLDIQD